MWMASDLHKNFWLNSIGSPWILCTLCFTKKTFFIFWGGQNYYKHLHCVSSRCCEPNFIKISWKAYLTQLLKNKKVSSLATANRSRVGIRESWHKTFGHCLGRVPDCKNFLPSSLIVVQNLVAVPKIWGYRRSAPLGIETVSRPVETRPSPKRVTVLNSVGLDQTVWA